jgi:hypothetical protein
MKLKTILAIVGLSLVTCISSYAQPWSGSSGPLLNGVPFNASTNATAILTIGTNAPFTNTITSLGQTWTNGTAKLLLVINGSGTGSGGATPTQPALDVFVTNSAGVVWSNVWTGSTNVAAIPFTITITVDSNSVVNISTNRGNGASTVLTFKSAVTLAL